MKKFHGLTQKELADAEYMKSYLEAHFDSIKQMSEEIKRWKERHAILVRQLLQAPEAVEALTPEQERERFDVWLMTSDRTLFSEDLAFSAWQAALRSD